MGAQALFRYHETIHSDGIPRKVDYKARNRRVTRVWTYDRTMDFTYTDDVVFINGPHGTEVVVEFEIR